MESLDNSYNAVDLLTNYLMLAQAIMFSDYDNGQDFCVCLYDTKENDRLVAVFNDDNSVARMFDMTKLAVQKNRSYGILIKGRFRTERFDCGTTSSKTEYCQIIMKYGMKQEIGYIRKMTGR